MQRLTQMRRSGLLALIFCYGLLIGCSKPDNSENPTGTSGEAIPATTVEATEQEIIPGENAVKEAITQKQWTVAVERYNALKVAVATPEQNEEYLSLYGQLRTELENAAQTDTKAAEAYAMFQFMRNRR